MNKRSVAQVVTQIVLGFLYFPTAIVFSEDIELPQGDSACRLPELRDELTKRVELDQKVRKELMQFTQNEAVPSDTVLDRLRAVDRENTEWMKQIIEKHGWPGKSLVGVTGAHNAWLLVQHADADRAFQKKCLRLMKVMPPGEVSSIDIAYLSDRLLCAEGKPQKYGTQLTRENGKLVLHEVEDRAALNDRRQEVGLQPIEEYLDMVEQTYGQQIYSEP